MGLRELWLYRFLCCHDFSPRRSKRRVPSPSLSAPFFCNHKLSPFWAQARQRPAVETSRSSRAQACQAPRAAPFFACGSLRGSSEAPFSVYLALAGWMLILFPVGRLVGSWELSDGLNDVARPFRVRHSGAVCEFSLSVWPLILNDNVRYRRPQLLTLEPAEALYVSAGGGHKTDKHQETRAKSKPTSRPTNKNLTRRQQG